MRGEHPLSSRQARNESEHGLLSSKIKTVVFITGVVLLLVLVLDRSAQAPKIETVYTRTELAGSTFNLEVSSTPEAREQGLSGRNVLADGSGMLFEFSVPDKACFWMKDINFNLDILWFDANKKLIHQQQNVNPSTYPQSFCPPSLATYVMEINPKQISPKIGDELVLQKQ